MRLFRNLPPGPIIIGAFLIIFVLAIATQCRAETIEAPDNGGFSEARSVRVDVETGFTILRARTPAIAFNATFEDVGGYVAGRDFDLQVGVGIIGDYQYKGVHESNQLYVHALLVDGFGKLDIGLGAVYLQNTDQINGSNLNASLLAGWRFTERVAANWRHFSNAGTKMPNLGRDFVNLVVRF